MNDATGYAWHVGTLVDGKITYEVPTTPQGTAWQSVMDDAGQFTVTAALSDQTVADLNLRATAEPCRCFLALAYTDDQGTETFIDGGPIWSHQYDQATKLLTIRAAGLWSLWDHRFILPVLADPTTAATAVTAYTGLSLGTIAKRLLELAFTHTNGSVPVVLPADETGDHERTYPGYEMDVIGAELRNISSDDGGPEIQFIPSRQTDQTKLQWTMRAGTTEQPALSQAPAADWVWDAYAPKGSASNIKSTMDGSATRKRQWVQGSGTDVTMMFAEADDPDTAVQGFPLLEALDGNHTSVTLQSTINGYATADLAANKRPLETWTFVVQRDETPSVGSYRVGDWARLHVENDPYLPDGDHRARITSIQGDAGNQVTIAVAPTLDTGS